MPGACLMTSTSAPSRPLVISLSAPLRITGARLGEPDPVIAAEKPAAIDSTDTNTTTTPAIPTTATADELSRAGIVRRFSAVTAMICLSALAMISASPPPQRVGDREPHGGHRRHDARQHPHEGHQGDAYQHVARRQHE